MDDQMSRETAGNGSRIGDTAAQIGETAAKMGETASHTMMKQATEAVEGLRAVIEQASTTLRELTQVSGEWADSAQTRAREMASQVRNQGEWAVGTISRQVEQNPMTALVVAFGVGYLCGMMTRRSR